MYNHVPPFPYPWEYSNKRYKFPTAMELARFLLQAQAVQFDSQLEIYHLPSGVLFNADDDLDRYVLHYLEKLLEQQARVYQTTNPGEYPCLMERPSYFEKVVKAVKLLCPRASCQVSVQPQGLNHSHLDELQRILGYTN